MNRKIVSRYCHTLGRACIFSENKHRRGVSICEIAKYLYGEQSHGDETDPAVKGVEVRNGARLIEVVGIEDGHEADGHARDGQCVEHRVQEFHVDPPATSAYPV